MTRNKFTNNRLCK